MIASLCVWRLLDREEVVESTKGNANEVGKSLIGFAQEVKVGFLEREGSVPAFRGLWIYECARHAVEEARFTDPVPTD